jgi:hypothetical protein
MDEWVMWGGVKTCAGLATVGPASLFSRWCATPEEIYKVGVVVWILALVLLVGLLFAEGARLARRP